MSRTASVLLAVFIALAGCEQSTPNPDGPAPLRDSVSPIASSATPAPEQSPPTAETTMSTQELISLIRAGYDDRAIIMASASGPGVFDSVQPLLGDTSPQVRAISLRVLDAADAQRAQPLAVQSLSDPSDDVKTFAVAILRPNPPTGIMAHLLSAYSTAREPALRGQIALLAGRVTPTDGIDAWRMHWANESDPYAKEDVGKALARMGDEPARKDFVATMNAAQGRKAFDTVRGTRYFEDKWIVPHLVPMLSRRDVALHLAADFPDTHPFRVCDVALEAILALTGEQVKFQTPRPTQYSDSEIAAVAAIAKKHSP